jgi:ABC-type Fe3+/spermidine/putrescine transport system ATPase subunit
LEVYSNPANAFVADLMGSSNIFNAATSDPYSGAVDIGWDSFAVQHPRPDTASVCIKPKDVMLVADGTADNSFEAKVIARSFLGDFFKIVVAPTAALSVEIALHVFQYDAAPPAEGDVIWVRFPPQHLQPLAS